MPVQAVIREIPINPCALPCLDDIIRGFWAEIAEFRARTKKIRC